ncbi:MAG: glucokinase [Paracoccaceae bacterium]|nr:glucokinase [Paracoccaceae bacterium]
MVLSADRYALVADTGGTNTRVALAEGSKLLPDTVRRYANAEHEGLGAVLETFIAENGGVDCAAAAVAVAGPVRDGKGTLTNLDWEFDEATVARATRAEHVAVVNDLQAQGHALGHLDAKALTPIVEGPAHKEGASRLVIGVGTGFNAAPVHEGAFGRLVAPAEAGHVTLPVRSEADLRLAEFLAREHGFASVEDALSGRGLGHLYAWLGEEAGAPGTAGAAEIMRALTDGSDPRAEETARLFARLLGAVAGDLALTMLPFGGVYLSGGVSRAFAPYLVGFGFTQAFRDKGRFSSFMENFAVSVIEDDFAALHGLAHHLARLAA